MTILIKTEREAQVIIRGLCKIYEVPLITVRKVSSYEIPTCEAVFYPDKYEIVFRPGIEMKILVHEFGHYLLRLVHITQVMEETICDQFATGSMIDVENMHP